VSKFRTPLRYPGGKQRLAPFIAEILEANEALGGNYCEPFAGGAGVAMELLVDQKVGRVYLNDSSRHIYAFWRAILDDPDEFCSRISRAALTIETWKRHRAIVAAPKDHDLMDLGFSTFYLNRCNRSGILSAGVIGGLKQEGEWGIDARFPRKELIGRIDTIASLGDRIVVANLDAEKFMTDRISSLKTETMVYCDPPYYERAQKLYWDAYQPDDHARLAKVIQNELSQPWVVSYDGHRDIGSLYRKRRRFRYELQYSAVRAYAGTELFVFSDDVSLPRSSCLPYVSAGLRNLRRSA
jgi:DNA adenine methylase